MADAGAKLFALATRAGNARLNDIWKRQRRFAAWWREAIYWPLWLAIIWPALHKIGLTYATGGVSGGAPLPPAVHETVQAWGLPLRDMFGMTETGGIGAQAGAWPAVGGALRPMTACQVRLTEEGELCLRSPGNISAIGTTRRRPGPCSTAFLHPLRRYRRGRLRRIIPRRRPQEGHSDHQRRQEHRAGDRRERAAVQPLYQRGHRLRRPAQICTALIEIDFENVAQWARQKQIAYTGHMSLAGNRHVTQLIAAEVEQLNGRLARVEQVKKFRILPKELVPEDGDTTPTRKAKRAHAYKLFGLLVEEMYAEGLAGPNWSEPDQRECKQGGGTTQADSHISTRP